MSAHVLVTYGSRQAVAQVTGELDIATAPRIRQALIGAVHRHGRVIIDLGRLEFCDCAGLSALIAAQNTARVHGTALAIRNIPPPLTRLLRCISHTLPIELPPRDVVPAHGLRVGSR
ncbi:STAS domain-containing protein [Streptomyces sp. NPDC058664]|uniref:STAS domain-containing protein n=1 Tax=unclassified Streptomyces TaxID=2593676 RepID=UPI00365F8FC1